MVIVTGVPNSGKSLLAEEFTGKGLFVFHTDSMKDMPWGDAIQKIKKLMDEDKYDVMIGVKMLAAVRSWLKHHEKGKPCETFVWCSRPLKALTPGQLTQAKGLLTQWDEIRQDLDRRGVDIVLGSRAIREKLG
ncbi:MAG: hypothetical protein ACREXR_01700 [Gammaproteobacteria bacterium]